MDRKNVEVFLKGFTFNSRYEFFEGKEVSKELIKIAAKRGIKLPSHDLAVFKCVYAFVDEANLNGCILPKEEVEKSLDTLVGKSIDFDHIRQRIVGHWIHAELKGDEIIAYGVFYKSSLNDDYELIKDLLEKGQLGVSFEAWGDKEKLETGEFNLRDIEFAGGALLVKEQPAFPKAGVLEMSKRKRVLELAKVLKPPAELILSSYNCECLNCGYRVTSDVHCKDMRCPKCGGEMRRVERPSKNLDQSSLNFYDTEFIGRSLSLITKCPFCGIEAPIFEVKSIDYDKNEAIIREVNCGSEFKVSFNPNLMLVKKGKMKKESVEMAMSNFEEFFEGFSVILDEAKLPQEVIDCVKKNAKKGTKVTEVVKQCWKTYKSQHSASLELEQEVEGAIEDLDLMEGFMVEDEDIDFEESKKLSYEEKKKLPDSMFAVVITKKGKNGKTLKIRKYPLNDETRVRAALRYLGMPRNKKSLQKLGVSIESVMKKILKRAKELNMKTLLERYKGSEESGMEEKIKELEQALAEKTAELEKSQATLEELKKVSKEYKDKVEEVEKAKVKEIEKAKKEAMIIAKRKSELGEFAKDLSDEDLLDDVKFENAKLKKELAELKKANKNNNDDKGSGDFSKGSKNKDSEDPVESLRKKVDEAAWGKAE